MHLNELISTKELDRNYIDRNKGNGRWVSEKNYLKTVGDVHVYMQRDFTRIKLFLSRNHPLIMSKNARDGEFPLEKNFIGMLFLYREELNSGEAWFVQGSYLKKSYRGKGYGQVLYKSALEQGLRIRSGDEQSKSARNFWVGMARDPRVDVWVQNVYSGQLTKEYTDIEDAYDPKKTVDPHTGKHVNLCLFAEMKF